MEAVSETRNPFEDLQLKLEKQRIQFQQEMKQIKATFNQLVSKVLEKSKISIESPVDKVQNGDYLVKTPPASDLVTKGGESTDRDASRDSALTEVGHLADDLFVVIKTIGDGPYTRSYVTRIPPPETKVTIGEEDTEPDLSKPSSGSESTTEAIGAHQQVTETTKANAGEEVAESCCDSDLIPVITEFDGGGTTASESVPVPVVTKSLVAIREKKASIDTTIHTDLERKEGTIQEFFIASETKAISPSSASLVASTPANPLAQPRSRNFVKDRGKRRMAAQERRRRKPRSGSVKGIRHRHRNGGRAHLWSRRVPMTKSSSKSPVIKVSSEFRSAATTTNRVRTAIFVKDRGKV